MCEGMPNYDLSLTSFEYNTYTALGEPFNTLFECNTYPCYTFTFSGQCEYEVTKDTVLGPLSWPVTIAGSTVGSIERCPLTTTYGKKKSFYYFFHT